MGTAVLVHGAWQGAWCWERVVPLLEEQGHGVVTPTLSGSGERASELSPEVDLDTHVGDVVASMEALPDDPVVLVGHSYSGMVVTGVVERVPERLAAVVFVDAFYPASGDSALGMMPPPFQQRFREQAQELGEGWRLPASDALLDVWGLEDADDRRWVRERLTDWSLRCFESELTLPTRQVARIPRWYVSGTSDAPSRAVFGEIAQTAADDCCQVVELTTGHDVMIEAPRELAAVILDALATT